GGEPELLAPKTTILSAVAEHDWSRVVIQTARNEVSTFVDGQTKLLARTATALQRIAVSPAGDIVLLWDGTAVWRILFGGGKLEKLADFTATKVQFIWSPDQ